MIYLTNFTVIPTNTTQLLLPGNYSSSHDYYGGLVTQIVLGIIAVLSIVGNMFVFVVFLYSPRLKNSSHGILIGNLALVDMLTGVSIIITPAYIIRENYHHPPPGIGGSIFCKIIGSELMPFSFGFISMYTLAVLSLERRYAVVRPMLHRRYFTIQRSKFVVVLVWILGIAVNITNILQSYYQENANPPCDWRLLVGPQFSMALYGILLFLRVVFPMVCVIVCYYDILRYIRQKVRNLLRSIDKTESAAYRIKSKITLTCAITSLAFLICWLPNQAYFTYISFHASKINDDLHLTTKLLIFFNSCINPFIYASTNRYYRREFVAILHLKWQFCCTDCHRQGSIWNFSRDSHHKSDNDELKLSMDNITNKGNSTKSIKPNLFLVEEAKTS
ncbi:Somatostatin receptor type 1 [Trichoplax sp. H2]|nr:Somatostatin receptor type 1 [Trichoplax sp. H2]|eukprot:RDD36903.1 Somatostatin receptor type 1 [Trichoplax sp. H2]